MLKVWHTLYLSESRILTVHTYILYRNTQFLKLVPWQRDYCISWIYFIYIVKHVVLFTSEQKIASHLFFLLMLQLHHTTMNDREEEKKQHLLSSWDRLTSPMTLNSLSGRKWIGGNPSRICDEILKSLHSKLTSLFPLSFLSLLFYLSPSVTPLSASPSHFRSREAWLHLGLW